MDFDFSGASQAFEMAAEEERQYYAEEEDMTPYSHEELAEDWEFKILRSATSIFKNPEKLRSILDEEAKAGWILVEKFDDCRVRLKRPPTAKRDDRTLSFDPYRTQIGVSGKTIGLVAVCLVIAVGFAVLSVALMFKG